MFTKRHTAYTRTHMTPPRSNNPSLSLQRRLPSPCSLRQSQGERGDQPLPLQRLFFSVEGSQAPADQPANAPPPASTSLFPSNPFFLSFTASLSFLLSLLTRAHSISIFLTISFPPLMLHPYSPSQPSPDFPLLVNKPASLPSPCLMLPCCLPISFNFIYLSSPPPFLLSSLLSSFPPLFLQFSLISSSI